MSQRQTLNLNAMCFYMIKTRSHEKQSNYLHQRIFILAYCYLSLCKTINVLKITKNIFPSELLNIFYCKCFHGKNELSHLFTALSYPRVFPKLTKDMQNLSQTTFRSPKKKICYSSTKKSALSLLCI